MVGHERAGQPVFRRREFLDHPLYGELRRRREQPRDGLEFGDRRLVCLQLHVGEPDEQPHLGKLTAPYDYDDGTRIAKGYEIQPPGALRSWRWQFDKQGKGDCKIAAYDLGMKWNILRRFTTHGCDVRVFPATAPMSELLATKPDGIFFSNGPGDPAALPRRRFVICPHRPARD